MSDELFYARLLAVVLLAAIGVAVVALMRPFAAPICGAILMAFVLQPVNLWARRRFHDRRGLGGVPLFGLLGAFLGPIIIALALALLRFAQEERAAL